MKYEVSHWQDNEYAVYKKDEDGLQDIVFRGTIEEVNAWISLKEKGYNI